MANIIFKTTLKQGVKGDTGDIGVSFEVPTGGVIGYLGNNIPEGYEETTAPTGFGSEILQYTITNNITSNTTITAEGEVN